MTRKELYEQVWASPMISIAETHGVSSSYLARVCSMMNVPRPPRGYWARVRVGQSLPRPPLPEAEPGDLLEWVAGGSNGGTTTLPVLPPSGRRRRIRNAPRLDLKERPLLHGAREAFEKARVTDVGYLRPLKWRLPDIFVSRNLLDRALEAADRLVAHFQGQGYRVMLAPTDRNYIRSSLDHREPAQKRRELSSYDTWSPNRPTVVFVGTVAIGLTLYEPSEYVEVKRVDGKYVRVSELPQPKRKRSIFRDDWTLKLDMPMGKLCLRAYSPYPRTNWEMTWRESEATPIEGKFKAVCRELRSAAIVIAEQVKEAEREMEVERIEWEKQRLRWEEERAAQRRDKALKDSKKQLLGLVDDWALATRIEGFFESIQVGLKGLSSEDQMEMSARLERARQIFGGVKALDHFHNWTTPEENLAED